MGLVNKGWGGRTPTVKLAFHTLAIALAVMSIPAAAGAPVDPSHGLPERGRLSPDSVPACASAAPTQADIDRSLAAQRASAGTPRPPLPPATEARPIRASAMPKHDCFLKVAQRGGIDLLFVGDSITDFFGRPDRGRGVWLEHYGRLKAADFGVSGDTTQDVLWRMRNGELDGFKARVIVLMLGANNFHLNDNADIAAGDAAIVAEFRKRQPEAKVLLLGIFPRGDSRSPDRASVAEINGALARLADDRQVFYADVGRNLLGADGAFKPGVMADDLHPSEAGYRIWADAMDPMLRRLMA
jgi:lysophospholipase L1-like esterase